MRSLATTALVLLAASVPARPPADPKGPPVDTSFLKQYAETRGFLLGRPTKPKVTPDGKHVLFLRADPATKRQSLFEFELAMAKTREVLSADTILRGGAEVLTPEEKARRERQRVSAGGFADYHLNPAGTHVLVTLANTLYVFDRGAGSVRALKAGSAGAVVDPKWSPDGKLIAYVRGFDVACYDLAADRELAVTTGGTVVKTHGLAEFVAQEEMGRHSGFWWSPDSASIAYTEADHTGVEQWWVADPLKPDAPPAPQYYPRPGKKNVSVRLGVKPVRGGDTVWVEWDRAKYEYLAAVKWDTLGGLTALVQDRKQQVSRLLKALPASGATTLLLEDRDATFLNLPKSMPKWIDERRFSWISEREGGPRLYLVDPAAEGDARLTPLSPDGLHVSDVVEVASPKGDLHHPIVLGTDNPTTAAAWLLSMVEDGRRSSYQLLRPLGPGVSSVGESAAKEPVYSFTSLKQMPVTFVVGEGTGLAGRRELPSVAAEPPFTPNVTVEKVGDFWTAVVRPRDFDAKKKYPVVLDVYGGPRHLHVVQAMRNWLVPQWLADQGFVVVAVDNRGTPGRGRDWERAVYQKFGTVPLDDQVRGVHVLCDKHPELDRDRVGIVGWSFGGYMAANGVLRRPDVFKAAVAGAPVTDWEDYDTHYTERYMGLLPESAAAYREASLLPLAAKLERPLLLVHGTADDNVYYRHTLRLSDALFRAGRPFEALALPGVTHMYSSDPVVMERLWARNAAFFRTHLGGPR